LRKERRYSQRALARALELSNTQVANYEAGVTVPAETRLRQIAIVLGISPQPLLRARRAVA
jgi:transcriptional regulator with XRE-family HTH domain